MNAFQVQDWARWEPEAQKISQDQPACGNAENLMGPTSSPFNILQYHAKPSSIYDYFYCMVSPEPSISQEVTFLRLHHL